MLFKFKHVNFMCRGSLGRLFTQALEDQYFSYHQSLLCTALPNHGPQNQTKFHILFNCIQPCTECQCCPINNMELAKLFLSYLPIHHSRYSSVQSLSQEINMSTQVSACSLAQIPKPKNRPVTNFHPNIWGDQFITYTPEDKVMQ